MKGNGNLWSYFIFTLFCLINIIEVSKASLSVLRIFVSSKFGSQNKILLSKREDFCSINSIKSFEIFWASENKFDNELKAFNKKI